MTQNVELGILSFTGYAPIKSNTASITYKNKSNLDEAFWMFAIGSVVGFIVETIWCLIKNGTIESRSSVILAPINAVYGIGALVLYIMGKCLVNKNILHIFAFGAVAGTVVEYLCSLFQETLFGSVSWDYSGQFLNIGGRVCLLYSVFWGLLAVLWFRAIQPTFKKLISKIPEKIYKPLTWGLAVFIAIVIVVSIVAVARWNTRIEGVPATNSVTALIDSLFPNTFMERIYPNMMFGN
jgi:uncharacterized membrane protein